jgi:hypothetical protein
MSAENTERTEFCLRVGLRQAGHQARGALGSVEGTGVLQKVAGRTVEDLTNPNTQQKVSKTALSTVKPSKWARHKRTGRPGMHTFIRTLSLMRFEAENATSCGRELTAPMSCEEMAGVAA